MDMENVPGSKKASVSSITPLNKQDRMVKRWKLAKKRTWDKKQQLNNITLETNYYAALKKIKQVLSNQQQTVFERDYKEDNLENALAMHAFLSPSFYFYLECDFAYYYQVEYAFNNCKQEAQIMAILKTYQLDQMGKQVRLQPDFSTFYRNVIAIQDKQYLYVL